MKGIGLIASLLAAGLLRTGMSAEEVAKRTINLPVRQRFNVSRARVGRKPQRRFGAPVSVDPRTGATWLTYSQHDALVRKFGAPLTRLIERKKLPFAEALAFDPFSA